MITCRNVIIPINNVGIYCWPHNTTSNKCSERNTPLGTCVLSVDHCYSVIHCNALTKYVLYNYCYQYTLYR